MNLDNCHLEAIIKSKLFSKQIKELSKDFPQLHKSLDEMTVDEYNGIYNVIYDLWQNDAPVVEEMTGYGSFGEFPIGIKGVKGAYYIFASEFDDLGPFKTKKEAIAEAESEYSTFLEDSE